MLCPTTVPRLCFRDTTEQDVMVGRCLNAGQKVMASILHRLACRLVPVPIACPDRVVGSSGLRLLLGASPGELNIPSGLRKRMFSDKETRVVEACLLVAVPLSIVVAAV